MATPDRDTRPRDWLPTWRLGHSGAMLAALGSIWVLIGVGLLATGDPPILPTLWPMTWLPTPVRAALWLVGGLIALAYAVRPRRIHSDGLAWTLLYIPPALRGLAYSVGWVNHLIPDGDPGYGRGWSQALLYLVIALLVLISSRWPDPARHQERR